MSYYGFSGSRGSRQQVDVSKMAKYHPNRVSNSAAGQLVTAKKNFKGSNTYGEWIPIHSRSNPGCQEFISAEHTEIYVAYSYGTHWPLFIFDPLSNQWFGNDSKYSQTTAIHRSNLRPRGVEISWQCVDVMKDIADMGAVEFLAAKINS